MVGWKVLKLFQVGLELNKCSWDGKAVTRGQIDKTTRATHLFTYYVVVMTFSYSPTNKHNAEIRARTSPRNAFLMIRKWKAVVHSVFPLEKEMNPGVFGFSSLSFVIC